jgi:serine-type D-Ala-D-Ala carboxypeptidase (penicillin-binding protein 5/6)
LRALSLIVAALALPLFFPAGASARTVVSPARRYTTTTAPAPPPLPKAWIVVDADTGKVLSAGNDRIPLPPASLTKVLTALTVVNTLPPDAQDVPVSARAAAAPADKISMKEGEVWTLTDTLYSLFLSSANDAAVALAERAGGTVEGFQKMFTATAADLGLADDPVLMDPAGLDGPEGVEGGNLVSARDLAIAARALLAQPLLATIVSTPIYHFVGPDGFHHRLLNHNHLFLQGYAGAVGVKTGYTKRAGHCLIAAAQRDGRTMLAVVMNGADPIRSAEAMLDQGFATPVEAEPVAEVLPPVRLGPPTVAGKRVAPAQPPTTGIVGLPAAHHGSSLWWLPWAVFLFLGTISVLRLRVVLRNRHRRRWYGYTT